MQQAQTLVLTMAFGALIAWRLFRRTRRLVGRQSFHRTRTWLSAVLFPLLLVVLAVPVFAAPAALAALAGGVAAGIGLGVLGLRLTRFKSTADGFSYTPNAYLGIALSGLLVARLAWRFGNLALAGAPLDRSSTALTHSPLTLLLVGMLAGYYATYAVGLLRTHARAISTNASPAAR